MKSDWFIEWDQDALHVTHARCNTSLRVEQGAGSPLYVDTLDALIAKHRCTEAGS